VTHKLLPNGVSLSNNVGCVARRVPSRGQWTTEDGHPPSSPKEGQAVTQPLLASRDRLICHLRSLHVEPVNGVPDWRMEDRARAEAADGFSFGHDELLLIGGDPQLVHVRDGAVRETLERLLAAGRRITPKHLQVPPGSHVSSVQIAAWFERGRLLVASVGRNAVDIQRWGGGRQPLPSWPGVDGGQLVTLWLPLTEGRGSNLRWRVALAYTGPDELLGGRPAVASTGGPPSTSLILGDGVNISELQLNVIVERFKAWLNFPAKTYQPSTAPVLEQRPGEVGPRGRPSAKRRDTRLDRLKAVINQLSRQGHSGTFDLDFLRALVEHGAITPMHLRRYPELDLRLLTDLGLLPRR
jgi:hypothetical protein